MNAATASGTRVDAVLLKAFMKAHHPYLERFLRSAIMSPPADWDAEAKGASQADAWAFLREVDPLAWREPSQRVGLVERMATALRQSLDL